MQKRFGSGRKTTAVAILFNDVITGSKISKAECTFCSKRVTKNGTRLSNHIKECKKCPTSIKEKFIKSTRSVPHSENIAQKQVSSTASTSAMSSASAKCKTSDISTFKDKMSPEDQDEGDKLLSRAIYASRAPLSMMDNPCWKEFFMFLRPAYKIPSRHMLSGPFLENEYKKVSTMVTEAIAAADSVGLAVDGWSNIRNEPIVHFVVTTPKPFLYKVLPTGKYSHTAEFMAREISFVIDEIGPQKVFGLVTDNAPNMKATWKLLEKKYAKTNLFIYGCLVHSLQLIFTDIKTLPSLKTLTATIALAATICINTIKNSQKLNTAFIEQQSITGDKINLKLPVKTCWDSLVSSLESLRENKQTIRAIAIDKDLTDALNKTYDLKRQMLSDDFWDLVAEFSSLLKSISDPIKTVESYTPQLSHVLSSYKKIEDLMKNMLKESSLTRSERQKFRKILERRKEFVIYDVHKIANLLDPHFKGCDLTPEVETIAKVQICNTAVKMPDIDENTVLIELANYIEKKDFCSKTFLWSLVNKLTPMAWWEGLCKSTALSKVALKFLSLPTTSAVCERSFCIHSDIHCDMTDASKIVYIAHNLKLQSQSLSQEHKEQPEKENVTMSQIVALNETEEEKEEEVEEKIEEDIEEDTEDSDYSYTDEDETSVSDTDTESGTDIHSEEE